MNERSRTLGAVAFALCVPTVVTWLYFVALADHPASVQRTAYSIGKVLQFGFPIVWVVLVVRPAWRQPTFTWRGVGLGVAFGAAIGGLMLALYHLWLVPTGFFDDAGDAIRDKIAGMKLDSAAKFAALGVFYSLAHSAMEEYYWRWFVFRQLRQVAGLGVSTAVSSLGFMAHHVIVLATYFGWTSPATWLFSLSIAVGGSVWAWLYERSGSLVGPWLSHLLIDAAIFVIGYDLARELFLSSGGV